MLTLGASTATLQSLVPQPLPPIAPMADLGSELFGHLDGLPGDGAAAAKVPLTQVALVALGRSGSSSGDSGCVLGLRVSHMVGDYGTLRALLHQLARAYNRQPLSPADVPASAAPLVAALAVPPPPGARQHNYLPFPPDIGEQLAAITALPPLQGLVLHVPAARLAELKAHAAADHAAAAAAAAGIGSAAAESGGVAADVDAATANGMGELWVSTHDALMAWWWRTVAALPCRRGAVVAFNQVGGCHALLVKCPCCVMLLWPARCLVLWLPSVSLLSSGLIRSLCPSVASHARAWTCVGACQRLQWEHAILTAPRPAGCTATWPPVHTRRRWMLPRCRWAKSR